MERLDLDFTRARRRASLARLAGRFGFGSGRDALLDFEQEKKRLGAIGERSLGSTVVEVSKIVGSVGRSGDFDASFMPKRAKLKEKWEHVDRQYHLGKGSRPVSLNKIGDKYFVSDGNHHVSVARFHGVEMIDAEVTEFRPLPNNTPSDGEDPAKQKNVPARA